MDFSNKLLPTLSILVSAVLVAFVVTVFILPAFVIFLPWAGFLAGLLAVLQALSLREAEQTVRNWLAFAGLATMLLMLIAAFLK